jgi:mycothiol synthase
MEQVSLSPAVAADAAAVTEVVVAAESSLYGTTIYSQADLEDEWAGLDLSRDVRVARDGTRIVGYGALHARGELCRAEGCVHPEVQGRGIGRLIATDLEHDAARRGASRIQNSVFEPDTTARALLESLGYRAVRVFRELRVELMAPPPAPQWPDGFDVSSFDVERDAHAFHAAQQEAFADHWEFTPRDFTSWSKSHLESERFDPELWCVVRTGDEIAAGAINSGATYGGGWVHVLFTRRPWRKRGLGAGLLYDAFERLWHHGERSVGLSVDAANETGAFQLYERAGMAPALGWVMYEKELSGGA